MRIIFTSSIFLFYLSILLPEYKSVFWKKKKTNDFYGTTLSLFHAVALIKYRREQLPYT